MEKNTFSLKYIFVLQFRKHLKRKKTAEKIHFQSGPPGLDDARRAEIQEQILRYRESIAVSISDGLITDLYFKSKMAETEGRLVRYSSAKLPQTFICEMHYAICIIHLLYSYKYLPGFTRL